MKASIAQKLFDLVQAEPFVPFVIHFASGQTFEIKTRDHIGIGPVTRLEGRSIEVDRRLGRQRPVAQRLHAGGA